MAEHKCLVPRIYGDRLSVELRGGETTIIVGANGSGKTRLGVFIESQIPAKLVHRIAAQKSLSLSDSINLIPLEQAFSRLRFGHIDGNETWKASQRWGNKPAVHLLSDFDALLQTLFAKHNRLATRFLQDARSNAHTTPPLSELERLRTIWQGLLPHRSLVINEANIQVDPDPTTGQKIYAGGEMSDGERAIFYFLGQCLLAPENAAIIIDEPEAHVHRSIIQQLWNSIEQARPDCCFLYITHDVDFAGTHKASKRYLLKSYVCTQPHPVGHRRGTRRCAACLNQRWSSLQELVARSYLSKVTAESVDLTIYRSQYSGFLAVPLGSCEAVIHSVTSFKTNPALHRLEVRGIVDADDRSGTDISALALRGIHALPVCEVENLFLLPDVFLALTELFLCPDPPALLKRLTVEIAADARSNLDFAAR